LPAGPLDVALLAQVLHVSAQLRDPATDVLAVDLQLRLPRASRPDAASEPAHRLAPAPEPREQVVELGQLDLRLPLLRVRVQGEDVQDQGGAVDDLDLEPRLEGAQGAGAELVIEDDELGPGRVEQTVQVLDLALPDPVLGIGRRTALDQAPDRLRACRV